MKLCGYLNMVMHLTAYVSTLHLPSVDAYLHSLR